MAVDSAELDRHPVDHQDIALHADLPDSDLLLDDLSGRFHIEGIEIGILTGPQMGRLNGKRRVPLENEVRGLPPLRVQDRGRCRDLPVQVLDPDRDLRAQGLWPRSRACLLIPVDPGIDEIIIDTLVRTPQQIDIPEDPRHPELVLVLQIRAVAPLEDQDGQDIVPLPDQVRDIEFREGVRHLAVAQILSVQPGIKAGVHPLEFQIGPGRRLALFKSKMPDIGAAGIVQRHIGRVGGEGITDICVLVAVITVILPDPGDGDLLKTAGVRLGLPAFLSGSPGFPVRLLLQSFSGHCPGLLQGLRSGLKVRLKKLLLQIINTVIIAELPCPVQHQHPVGRLPVFHRVLHAHPGRYIIGAVRHRPLVKNRQIFIIPGYDHCFSSCFP